METGKPLLRPALRKLTARKAGELRDHPSSEVLAAYQEGRLTKEEADRLRDHLALCSECTQFLLDLSAFTESGPAAAAGGPTDSEIQAAWQAMQARLGKEASSKRPTGPHVLHLPPARPEPPRARPVRTWALAASWLLVAGLGVWVTVLERENVQLRKPSAEVATVELHAAEATRGETEPAERKSVSAGRRAVLHLEPPTGFPALSGYEVEIAAEGGSGPAIWRGPAERDPEQHDFTVFLRPRFLSPGLYQVRLYAAGGGETAPLAVFSLEVRPP